jgi:hypothetical protein
MIKYSPGIHTVSISDLVMVMLIVRSGLKWLRTIFMCVFKIAMKQWHQ